jgi:hypothetical protein
VNIRNHWKLIEKAMISSPQSRPQSDLVEQLLSSWMIDAQSPMSEGPEKWGAGALF